MQLPEDILTLTDVIETKIKEKGSNFICYSYHIDTLDGAHLLLEQLRNEYYAATHVCYAIRLDKYTFKYSDDGEPSGTAGLKILNAIDHFNLNQVLVTVVRYFGGVKLGVGPLAKAYYNSALENLEVAKKITKSPYIKAQLNFGFTEMNHVYHCLSSAEVKNMETNYTDRIELTAFVKYSDWERVKSNLIEMTGGKVEVNSYPDILYF